MTNEEIAREIQNGKTELILQLWYQCYDYIKLQAKRWARAWESRTDFDMEDLIQSGYFAIVKAVEGYQPERDCSFIGFLNLCLKSEFSQVVRCHTSRQMNDPIYHSVRFEAPVGGDFDDMTVGDTIGADCEAMEAVEEADFQEHLAKAVRGAVASLPHRQRIAVEEYYLDGKKYADIAALLHVSRSRAREICENGLREIRKGDHADRLAYYLYGERNLYRKTGYASWKYSGCSQPEREAIIAEKKLWMIEQLMTRHKMSREEAVRIVC